MATIQKNLIPIEKIVGVDIKNLTFDRPKDLPNYKLKLREEVLDSLKQAKNPTDIPPIPVLHVGQGKYKIVDGEHRLRNALWKLKTTGDEIWKEIHVYKDTSVTNVLEGSVVGLKVALGESSSVLTDDETFLGVKDLLERFNNDKDEVLSLIGTQNKRVVNMVNEILENGTESLQEAIKEGGLDIKTADKIAKKGKNDEEKDNLANAAKALKQNGTSDKEVNRLLQLRKDKSKLISWKQALEYAMPIVEDFITGYDEYLDQKDSQTAKPLTDFVDEVYCVKFEVISAFFGFEEYTLDSQVENFRAILEDYQD